MEKLKIISLLAIAVLVLGFSGYPLGRAKAAGQELQGYIYSETAGWISLNCSNTNSCSTIDYKVSEDSSGKLSGYGYSQDGEWINLDPNYGGTIINSDGTMSGQAFADKGEWLKFDSAKIISAGDLQNEIISAQTAINSDDLSDAGAMSLLNSLCSQFLTSSECSIINE